MVGEMLASTKQRCRTRKGSTLDSVKPRLHLPQQFGLVYVVAASVPKPGGQTALAARRKQVVGRKLS